MVDTPKPKARERFCFNCGVSLGVIEDRYYDRLDTCGDLECERAAQEIYREDREDREAETELYREDYNNRDW